MTEIVNNKTGAPLKHYREAFAQMDPEDAVRRLDKTLNEGYFTLTFLQQIIFVEYPCGTAISADSQKELGDVATILLLRYLTEGIRAETTGRFLSYAEIPWGSVYLEPFTNRCIKRLAFSFGTRLEAFERACKALGATRISSADCAYEVPFLDNLKVQLLLWRPDEEFPPSAQILFSDNILTAFTAEDLASIMDLLISELNARA